MNISFFCNQLIINNKACQKNHLQQLIENGYSASNTEYLEELTCIIDGDFAKLFFKSGDPTPRSPELVDIQTHESTDNLRQRTQVEPKFYYGVIDFRTGWVWLPYKVRKLFQEAISFFHTNSHLKPIINEDEFIKKIKNLKEVTFGIATDSLLNDQSTLGASLSNEILAYGANYAELTLKFDRKTSIKEKIRNILNNKSAYQKLVIAGHDNKGFDHIFDLRAISTKLSINVPQNHDGMFIETDLFQQLIKKLQDET